MNMLRHEGMQVQVFSFNKKMKAAEMMRLLLICLALLHWEISAAEPQAATSGLGRQPMNVLFIGVDDLRTNLGCYGDSFAITPNIDRLASRGTCFLRAYVQQAVCNPSRASLMTGRRPDTTKVWDLETHFRKALPDVVTLPQYFKGQGYHARAIGKIYHDPEWAQDKLSWSEPEMLTITKRTGKYVLDKSLPRKGGSKGTSTERAAVADNKYIDGQVCEAALKALDENKDRPFFLAVGFRRPHLPFSAPEKYWNLYERSKVPLPGVTTAPATVPAVALHNSTELRGYTDVPASGTLSAEQTRELIHGYYACTSYVDAQVGRLLEELDRLELTSNTIVVLWSDHGFHLGEKGLWCKTTNFELDTRVPLIISAPGQKSKGTKSRAIVELVDLYPTLVELAELPETRGLAGTSLKRLLDEPGGTVKEAAYSQFPRPFPSKDPKVMGYSVRTDGFRYTEWRDVKSGRRVAEEFYDHRSDASETVNVVGEMKFADEVEKHRGLLK